ncbi:MAG: hypothetical protein HYR96_06650 [Deltaproteobacteria bacterium]|nr:hypothetical protein [Deltaproteobacteria bacterium]MBI3296459.1 hypothetical protein [Deltaproteobacteria bacterium]
MLFDHVTKGSQIHFGIVQNKINLLIPQGILESNQKVPFQNKQIERRRGSDKDIQIDIASALRQVRPGTEKSNFNPLNLTGTKHPLYRISNAVQFGT